MRHGEYKHLLDADMACTRDERQTAPCQSLFHQAVTGQKERCKGCRVDSHLPAQQSVKLAYVVKYSNKDTAKKDSTKL